MEDRMSIGPYPIYFEEGFEDIPEQDLEYIVDKLKEKYDFPGDIIPKKFRMMEREFQESGETKVKWPEEIIFRNPEVVDDKLRFTGILKASARKGKGAPYYMNIGKFNISHYINP